MFGVDGLISGGMGLLGAEMTNSANAANVAATNQANMQIAADNRNWQEHMANTAYQRAMTDMRAAGLNPMLAYSQGGAATPTPPTPTMQSFTRENTLGKGVSSALDAMRFSNEKKAADSSSNLNDQNAELAKIKSDTERSQQALNADLAAKTRMDAQKSLADKNVSEAMKYRIDQETAATAIDVARRSYEMPAFLKEVDARSKGAEVDSARSTFDLKAIDYDNYMKRASDFFGTANSARSTFNGLKMPSMPDNRDFKEKFMEKYGPKR